MMRKNLSLFVSLLTVLVLNSFSVFARSSGPLSGIADLLGTGSKSILDMITNPYVFIVLISLILVMLFYFIFLMGLRMANFAKAATANDDAKTDFAKKISILLAILATIGLLGFAGYDNNQFSIGNIQSNVNNVLGLFGASAIWIIAFLIAALTYTMGMGTLKHLYGDYKDSYEWTPLGLKPRGEKKALPAQRRIGVLLLSFGIFMWVGNTLAETVNSYDNASLGMVMAFVGLMMLIWPNNEKDPGQE